MPIQFSPDQVLSLAPDEGSRKNARALASSPHKWSTLGRSEQAVWGSCQGSGADPYRCQIDLNGPGFKCSCPSRKLPCKHVLGLFLLYASQPEHFEASEPPDWVSTWLARRAEQSERRAAKTENRSGEQEEQAAQERRAAQARRTAEREKKVRAGIADLDTWLCDLLHQGLASAQSQPHAFWENTAGRLVDAQAPGLARMVRDMAGIPASGEGWQGRLLDALSHLYLAMEGYRRIETLPDTVQEDLRSLIGFTIKQEDLLASTPGITDTWLVMGRHTQEENNLRTRRLWLWGTETARSALLLSFAIAGNDFEPGPAPGMVLQGELVFYPSAYPLRAAVRSQQAIGPIGANHLPGCAGFLEATGAYAAALAQHPWIERFPMAVKQVTPFQENGEWGLCDEQRRWVPLARNFLHAWRLMAISGGRPLGVFGEWNGNCLLPLSAWSGRRFAVFPAGLG